MKNYVGFLVYDEVYEVMTRVYPGILATWSFCDGNDDDLTSVRIIYTVNENGSLTKHRREWEGLFYEKLPMISETFEVIPAGQWILAHTSNVGSRYGSRFARLSPEYGGYGTDRDKIAALKDSILQSLR